MTISFRSAAFLTMIGVATLASTTAFAGKKHYTCDGLRHCGNFKNACLAAGGDYSIDTPSTPGGGPITNHCHVNEARVGVAQVFEANPEAPALNLLSR